jgi:hypothetical protein
MTADPDHILLVRLPLETEDEVEALEQALLRARASELSEVRRNQVRLGAGYGDDSGRATMTDEQARADLRREMLDRVLEAVRQAGKDRAGQG